MWPPYPDPVIAPALEELDPAGRMRRPAAPRRVTFAELAKPGPQWRVDGRELVPLEQARAGDRQLFAARAVGKLREPVLDLDPLAAAPQVESIVASTVVRATRPLPHIKELLLLHNTRVPEPQTLRCLTGLQVFWAGYAPSNQRLDVAALPAGLRALGLTRSALGEPPAALARFEELRELYLAECLSMDSLEALGRLRQLERLRADAPAGWSSMKSCALLEEVSAIQPRLASLRALRGWTRLRKLVLTGRNVKSLAGLEAFAQLAELRLVMLNVADLSPLAGLGALARLELVGLRAAHDLAPLGRLPALRRLSIERAGIDERDVVHLRSLRPLASALELEELILRGAVVDDGDLTPLAGLPALRRVLVSGELGEEVAALRRAAPDLLVVHDGAPLELGAPPGAVAVRPPSPGIPGWRIREDLTELLDVASNAEAEQRVRDALADTAPALLARLSFDSEADAVEIAAEREEDAREVALLIARLAAAKGGGAAG